MLRQASLIEYPSHLCTVCNRIYTTNYEKDPSLQQTYFSSALWDFRNYANISIQLSWEPYIHLMYARYIYVIIITVCVYHGEVNHLFLMGKTLGQAISEDISTEIWITTMYRNRNSLQKRVISQIIPKAS